ncbi:MAG: hypothetical protein ABI680_13220 [Chthoniobacteraceae bacterium]
MLLAHDTALDIPAAGELVPDLVIKEREAITDLRKEVLRGRALMHPGIVPTHNFEKVESGAGIFLVKMKICPGGKTSLLMTAARTKRKSSFVSTSLTG